MTSLIREGMLVRACRCGCCGLLRWLLLRSRPEPCRATEVVFGLGMVALISDPKKIQSLKLLVNYTGLNPTEFLPFALQSDNSAAVQFILDSPKLCVRSAESSITAMHFARCGAETIHHLVNSRLNLRRTATKCSKTLSDVALIFESPAATVLFESLGSSIKLTQRLEVFLKLRALRYGTSQFLCYLHRAHGDRPRLLMELALSSGQYELLQLGLGLLEKATPGVLGFAHLKHYFTQTNEPLLSLTCLRRHCGLLFSEVAPWVVEPLVYRGEVASLEYIHQAGVDVIALLCQERYLKITVACCHLELAKLLFNAQVFTTLEFLRCVRVLNYSHSLCREARLTAEMHKPLSVERVTQFVEFLLREVQIGRDPLHFSFLHFALWFKSAKLARFLVEKSAMPAYKIQRFVHVAISKKLVHDSDMILWAYLLPKVAKKLSETDRNKVQGQPRVQAFLEALLWVSG